MAPPQFGTIEEIWRYPVSSLGGERLTSAELGTDGVVGDRTWCVADAQSGHPAAPEKEARWRPALFLHSRSGHDRPEIGFPDGEWLRVGERDTDAKLTLYFGFDVETRPYAGTGKPGPGDVQTAVNRYEVSPVHLVTTNSLRHLSTLVGTDDIDSRRFRPNVVLRTHAAEGFEEKSWLGSRMQMGGAIIHICEEAKRCGMTLIAQPGLPENPDVLRSVLRQNKRNFGIYGDVERSGTLSLGDAVDILAD
jgi:uncharacterized protein YcbX